MQRTAHLFLFLLAIGLLFACNGGEGTGDGEQPTQNPNADLEALPRTTYSRLSVRFSLSDLEGFKPVHRDSVPWASWLAETDGNGAIQYFFVKGHDVELASPQVRVEYISKRMPGCASVTELKDFLKSTFINDERNGKIVNEGETVQTMDGKKVEFFEIQTPQVNIGDTLRRSEKSMAWAYVDHGEWFVGFSYSAVKSDHYLQGLPYFKDLVRSYHKE